MRHRFLGFNNLSGTIPATFSSLMNLLYLYVALLEPCAGWSLKPCAAGTWAAIS